MACDWRRNARRSKALNDSSKLVEISEDEFERLKEAKDAFRDLAARMRAFALNEHLAVWFVRLWRYDPWEASVALWGSLAYCTKRAALLPMLKAISSGRWASVPPNRNALAVG
jgi:hypothetical protein